MSDRKSQMLADKYLRDSARALVDADIENLKTTFSGKSMGERALDRVREGAVDVYEEAVDVAENNKGALAAILAAVVVWFARNPIMSIFGLEPEELDGGDDEEAEIGDE